MSCSLEIDLLCCSTTNLDIGVSEALEQGASKHGYLYRLGAGPQWTKLYYILSVSAVLVY